jgi:multiple sugar transport system permease protein
VNNKTNRRRNSIILTICLLLIVGWSLGPILWSVVISITPQTELFEGTRLWPENPTLENYKSLFDLQNADSRAYVRSLGNSLKTSLLCILVLVPISTMAAYAFSRFRFWGKTVMHFGVLITFVIPVFATIIALYRMLGVLHLHSTYAGLVAVYSSAFLPLTMWLLVNHFTTIPSSLEEAARIDGCNRFQAFWRVVLPLSYQALLTSCLIVFMNIWNQFLIPVIIASSPNVKPFTVVISEFTTKTAQDYGMISAGGIVSLIPPILLVVMFSKYFIHGLLAGATKG